MKRSTKKMMYLMMMIPLYDYIFYFQELIFAYISTECLDYKAEVASLKKSLKYSKIYLGEIFTLYIEILQKQ